MRAALAFQEVTSSDPDAAFSRRTKHSPSHYFLRLVLRVSLEKARCGGGPAGPARAASHRGLRPCLQDGNPDEGPWVELRWSLTLLLSSQA